MGESDFMPDAMHEFHSRYQRAVDALIAIDPMTDLPLSDVNGIAGLATITGIDRDTLRSTLEIRNVYPCEGKYNVGRVIEVMRYFAEVEDEEMVPEMA